VISYKNLLTRINEKRKIREVRIRSNKKITHLGANRSKIGFNIFNLTLQKKPLIILLSKGQKSFGFQRIKS